MDVDYYLEKAHRIKYTATMADRYDGMFNNLKTMTPLNKDVQLKVIHSTSRSCYSFVFEDQNYIVMDQYLGQILNMLNRIFFNSNDPLDAIMYALKLLAQSYQLFGDPYTGAVCASMHETMKKHQNSYKDDKDIESRLSYGTTQEYFVLMHELSHNWLEYLDQKEREELFEITKESLEELFDDHIRLGQQFKDDLTENFIKDHYSALFPNDTITAEQIHNWENWEQLQKDFADINTLSFGGFKKGFLNRNDFIEELICDDRAITVLPLILETKHNIPRNVSLNAMLLGLYHLRLIANLHSVPARVDDSDIKNKGLFTEETLIRTSYFRDSARRLTMVLLGQEAQEQLQSSFISTNLRFSKIISDPILFRLLNTQGRLNGKILAMVDDIKAISEDELNRVIDQLS